MKHIFLMLLIYGISVNQLQAQQTHTVYFGFNQSVVTPQAKDSIMAWLAAQPFLSGTIIIKAHADIRGGSNYNQALSERRAKAVADMFRLACNNCTFQVESFGETMPVSLTEQRLNRRVEIAWTDVLPYKDTIQRTISDHQPDSVSNTGILLDIPALKNIYFRPDVAIIEDYSLSALNELAIALLTYPGSAVFEIRGHANAPGLKFDKLSEERAKEIYLHLIDLGLPANRLRYRGMGNKQMAFSNPQNEEEMRKNIRVDILVFK